MAEMTKVYLLNVPIDSTQENQLYFADKSTQYNYFMSRKQTDFTDFTYQRKDSIIRVPSHADDLLNANVNYVMYQNSRYGDRWFYAFVTDIEYINDNVSFLHIKTDVYQTWFIDCSFKKSFVEREHVVDDTPGIHTVDEGIPCGDYMCFKHDEFGTTELNDLCYVIASTWNPEAEEDCQGQLVNGIYSAVHYFPYDTPDQINAALAKFPTDLKTEAITGIFMIPKSVKPLIVNKQPQNSLGATNYTYSINKPDALYGDYVPKNNKLFTFPYFYIAMSNNAGGQAIYNYEYFKTSSCVFQHYISVCPGVSHKLIPSDYKGLALNEEEALTGAKYPICNFATDAWTNWLTQNGINTVWDLAIGIGSTAAGGVMALGSGGIGLVAGAGAIISGLTQTKNALEGIRQGLLMPNQAKGNTNCGDVTTSMGNNCFQCYQMSIKPEIAAIIDDYFTKYGYKVNKVKIPELNGRPQWNYVKTIDAQITGGVPTNDMRELKAIFNNGVTLWHHPENVGNYSLTNK